RPGDQHLSIDALRRLGESGYADCRQRRQASILILRRPAAAEHSPASRIDGQYDRAVDDVRPETAGARRQQHQRFVSGRRELHDQEVRFDDTPRNLNLGRESHMQPNHSPRSLRLRLRDEDGIALIVSLMAMMLLMALGLALIMTTTTETKIAGNYTSGTEALYAADSAVERVMDDILTVPDWNDILSGARQSAFIDGPAGGTRTLPDGSM